MRKPSGRQRKAMEKALRRWEAGFPESAVATPYIGGRGISSQTAIRFRLGVVSSDETGLYEEYAGRLAIPYLDRLGVYGFKFRCLQHTNCKEFDCHKYMNPMDQEVGIFNVLALDDDESDTLHVCEGEMDAIVLSQHTPSPCIGLPGADAWKDHWTCHFSGFERVVCWKHGDSAGNKWARRLRDKCRTTEIVELPPKEDVNSMILQWGPEKVLQLAEGDDDETEEPGLVGAANR